MPFPGRTRIFFGEGIGQPDFAKAVFQVFLVNDLDGFEMGLEKRNKRIGQEGNAVVFAFAVADGDLEAIEIYVFDAQAEAFHTCTCAALRRKFRCDAQAAAVEDFGHELGKPSHVVGDGEGFLVGEDGGEGLGFFGADDIGGDFDFDLENMAI